MFLLTMATLPTCLKVYSIYCGGTRSQFCFVHRLGAVWCFLQEQLRRPHLLDNENTEGHHFTQRRSRKNYLKT